MPFYLPLVISAFAAKVGGISAPYFADLGNVVDGDLGVALPLIIFGAGSVTGGVLALFLPETTNRILPDSVQDTKNFNRILHKHNLNGQGLSTTNMNKKKYVNFAFDADG